jgi:spermidine synthase
MEHLKKQAKLKPIKEDLKSIDINGPFELVSHLLMGPDQIKAYLNNTTDQTHNTDDNAYLEYYTPSEYLEKTEDIIQDLLPYVGFDENLIKEISENELAMIRKAWNKRKDQLLSELGATQTLN